MGLGEFNRTKRDGPVVAIANISQDHWRDCARGPSNPEEHSGHQGPWTAVDNPDPSTKLKKGDIVLARKTNRLSNGQLGNEEAGVYGIWKYSTSGPVTNQEDHPWNEEYGWYLYCDEVETRYTKPIYNEDWNTISLTPQKMTGSALFTFPELSKEYQGAYLSQLIECPNISDDTAMLLK
jgi:hypothetical protein